MEENNSQQMPEEKATQIQKENEFQTQKPKQDFTSQLRKNPWILSTLVLGVIVLILLLGNFYPTGNVTSTDMISEEEAGQAVLDLAQAQVEDVELVSVETENNLYKITLLIEENQVPVYLTLDGKNLVNGLTPLAAIQAQNQQPPESKPVEMVKSDKPVVELFVMTHCPYGTQAEKGFLPAILELGDSIDPSVKFVHYFLHEPEETETPIQICIREEQETKFLPYLKCFLEDGDSDRCINEVKIDKTKLDTCVEQKSKEYYAIDSQLSEGYGVRGSPTLVVNGAIVESGRSADAYLKTICGAFNTAPEMCETLELDSANPSPGFGYGTTSGIANAQC